MEAIIPRCCGLDVHRDTVVACVIIGEADAEPVKHRNAFGTMTHELLELRKWLTAHGCTHVAMESTGVYWMPVYKVLEDHFDLVVGNAQHLSKVPGRKTDVLDSEWIAELLRCGLIRKSFVPPPPIRELRDLTRYRSKLVESRSSERNRLHKLLQTANIKLASVMSDVFGVSGMAMLRAMVNGELTPEQVSEYTRGRLRQKLPQLKLALDGTLEDHHRYLLKTQLKRLEQLDSEIQEVDKRIDAKLEPYREHHTRLMQIPGVNRVIASVIIAEMGVDMNVFENDHACASWAGVCPGNNESGGKRKQARARRGNPHLKTALVEAGHGASRKKGSYLRSKFHRLRTRHSYQKAIMAIAHKILIAAYHIMDKGEDYRELGETYLERKNPQRTADKLVKQLEELGFDVELTKRESSANTRPLQVAQLPVVNETASRDSVEDVIVDETSAAVGMDDTARGYPEAQDIDADPVLSSTDRASSLCEREGSDALVAEVPVEATDTSSPQAPVEPDNTPPLGDDTATQATQAPARKDAPERTPSLDTSRSSDSRDPRLPPVGTTLNRVFKDVLYQVQIREDGFEYQGTVFPSISSVARKITDGTCRNGYRFFRLNPQQQPGAPVPTNK